MMASVAPRHLCASCTRYIGLVGRCPYCDADTPHRRTLVLLRATALLLGIGGPLLLLAL